MNNRSRFFNVNPTYLEFSYVESDRDGSYQDWVREVRGKSDESGDKIFIANHKAEILIADFHNLQHISDLPNFINFYFVKNLLDPAMDNYESAARVLEEELEKTLHQTGLNTMLVFSVTKYLQTLGYSMAELKRVVKFNFSKNRLLIFENFKAFSLRNMNNPEQPLKAADKKIPLIEGDLSHYIDIEKSGKFGKHTITQVQLFFENKEIQKKFDKSTQLKDKIAGAVTALLHPNQPLYKCTVKPKS